MSNDIRYFKGDRVRSLRSGRVWIVASDNPMWESLVSVINPDAPGLVPNFINCVCLESVPKPQVSDAQEGQ